MSDRSDTESRTRHRVLVAPHGDTGVPSVGRVALESGDAGATPATVGDGANE